MKTSLSTKGQIVLPAELRELDQLQVGQQFEVERVQAGEYVLRKVIEPAPVGLVQWLLDCPVKDWFEEIPSQSTRELERRLSRLHDE